MIKKGEDVHVFVEIYNGIETVRVTSDESTADNWENDWIHQHGFSDMDEYFHAKENGHINHYFKTYVTALE